MVEDRDRRGVGRRVRRAKGAADQRGNSEKRKGIRRDQNDAHALRPCVAHEVHRLPVGAGDVLEDVALLHVVEELARRQRTAKETIRCVANHHVDQAIRMRVGKRVEDDIADDAVDDGGGADAEPERDDGHRREPWRAAERSQRVADVPPGIGQPAEPAGVTLHFLGLLDAAEFAPGREARRLGRQAAAAKVVFEDREMRLNLARQLTLGRPPPDGVDEPEQEDPDAPHGSALVDEKRVDEPGQPPPARRLAFERPRCRRE